MEQESEPFDGNELVNIHEPESSKDGTDLLDRLSECFHHIAFLENQNDFLRLKLKLTIKHCLHNDTKDFREKQTNNDQQKVLKEQFVQTDVQETVYLQDGNNYESPEPSRKMNFCLDGTTKEDPIDESNVEDDEDGELLKTPVVVELSNSLSNLKWGFKKRESKLKKELKSYKAALQYLNANHEELRTKFKEICNSLCDQLDTAEAVQQLREQQKVFLEEQETNANQLIDQLNDHDTMLKSTLEKISSEVHNLAEESQAQLESSREKTLLARSERNQYLLAAKELEAELEEQELAALADAMGTHSHKSNIGVNSNPANPVNVQSIQHNNSDNESNNVNDDAKEEIVAPEIIISRSQNNVQDMIIQTADKIEKKKKEKKRKEKRHSTKKSSRRPKKVSRRSSKKRRLEESSDDSHSIASYSSSSFSSDDSYHSFDSLSSTPVKKKHSSQKHHAKSLKKDAVTTRRTDDTRTVELMTTKESNLRQQILEYRIADEEFLEAIAQTQDMLGEWLSKVHVETNNHFLTPLKSKYSKEITNENDETNNELEIQLTLAQEIITQLTMEKHKLEEELKRQKIDFDGQNRAKMRLLQELEAKNEELLYSLTQQQEKNNEKDANANNNEENDELNALLFAASPSNSPYNDTHVTNNDISNSNKHTMQSFSQQASFFAHSQRALSSIRSSKVHTTTSSFGATENIVKDSFSTPITHNDTTYSNCNGDNSSDVHMFKDEDSEESLAMERILEVEGQENLEEKENSNEFEEATQAPLDHNMAHVIGHYEFEEGEQEVEEDVHVISSVDDPFLSSPRHSHTKFVSRKSSLNKSINNVSNTSNQNNASMSFKKHVSIPNIKADNNSHKDVNTTTTKDNEDNVQVEEEKMSVEELLLGGKKPPKIPSSTNALAKNKLSNSICNNNGNSNNAIDTAVAMEELRRMLQEVETEKETLSIQHTELSQEKDTWLMEKVTLQQDKRTLEKENEMLAKENLRLKREVDLYRTKIFTVVTQDASQRTSSLASSMIQGLPDINLSFVASSQGLSANAVASEYTYLSPAGGHNASQQTLYIINQLVHAHNDLVERNAQLEEAHTKEKTLSIEREKQIRVYLHNLQDQETANLKMKRLLTQANSTISATVEDYRVLQEQVNLLTQKLTDLREENVHLQALVPPALRHQAIRFATQSSRQNHSHDTPLLLLNNNNDHNKNVHTAVSEDNDASLMNNYYNNSNFSDILIQKTNNKHDLNNANNHVDPNANDDISRESLYNSSRYQQQRQRQHHLLAQQPTAAVHSPPPLPYSPMSPRLRNNNYNNTTSTPFFSPSYAFNNNNNINNDSSMKKNEVSTADIVARLQYHNYNNYAVNNTTTINNSNTLDKSLNHSSVNYNVNTDVSNNINNNGKSNGIYEGKSVSRGELEAKLLEYSRRYPNSHTAATSNSSINSSNNKVLTYSSM